MPDGKKLSTMHAAGIKECFVYKQELDKIMRFTYGLKSQVYASQLSHIAMRVAAQLDTCFEGVKIVSLNEPYVCEGSILGAPL